MSPTDTALRTALGGGGGPSGEGGGVRQRPKTTAGIQRRIPIPCSATLERIGGGERVSAGGRTDGRLRGGGKGCKVTARPGQRQRSCLVLWSLIPAASPGLPSLRPHGAGVACPRTWARSKRQTCWPSCFRSAPRKSKRCWCSRERRRGPTGRQALMRRAGQECLIGRRGKGPGLQERGRAGRGGRWAKSRPIRRQGAVAGRGGARRWRGGACWRWGGGAPHISRRATQSSQVRITFSRQSRLRPRFRETRPEALTLSDFRW